MLHNTGNELSKQGLTEHALSSRKQDNIQKKFVDLCPFGHICVLRVCFNKDKPFFRLVSDREEADHECKCKQNQRPALQSRPPARRLPGAVERKPK